MIKVVTFDLSFHLCKNTVSLRVKIIVSSVNEGIIVLRSRLWPFIVAEEAVCSVEDYRLYSDYVYGYGAFIFRSYTILQQDLDCTGAKVRH